MLVKGLCFFVFCVNKKRIGSYMGPGLQTSVYGKTYQQRSQMVSTGFNVARKAPHSKARNRVAGQLFSFDLTELFDTDLCGAQCVKAQNFAWSGVVNQYKNRANALCALLLRILVQEVIQRGLTALEAGSVMQLGVKNPLFKHA